MRRGGGTRGSRGGGRSSFRSSRRHHRRYSYGRSYYGSRHYGYGYGYHSRGSGFIVLIIVMGFFFLFGIIAISAIFGLPNTYNVNLGPHETRLFHPNPATKNGMEVIDPSGLIETHFFNDKPVVKDTTIDRTENVTNLLLTSDRHEYFSFYLIKGSTVKTNWSSSIDIEFVIVKGTPNFDKWAEGESTESFSQYGKFFDYTYKINEDDDYYFVFYNSNSLNALVNIVFDIKAKAYDISDSIKTITGSFQESLESDRYIVVYNPTNDDLIFDFTETPKYSYGLIFLILSVISISATTLIVLAVKSRSKKSTQAHQIIPTGLSQGSNQSVFAQSQERSKALYRQRPTAKFCNACGSGLLPQSVFCSECGTKV